MGTRAAVARQRLQNNLFAVGLMLQFWVVNAMIERWRCTRRWAGVKGTIFVFLVGKGVRDVGCLVEVGHTG